MTPEERSQQKKRADKLEKWFANDLGGFKVPRSGAGESLKGDVYVGEYFIDSKHTMKSTIKLMSEDITVCHKQARSMGKEGHLILTFFQEDSHWGVVPEKYFDVRDDLKYFDLSINKSKQISKSYLTSCSKKAKKEGKYMCVRVTQNMPYLGVPKEWLILPYNYYKEILEEVNE